MNSIKCKSCGRQFYSKNWKASFCKECSPKNFVSDDIKKLKNLRQKVEDGTLKSMYALEDDPFKSGRLPDEVLGNQFFGYRY